MPILNVKVSAARSADMSLRISQILTELTVGILKKKRDLIAIAIDYVHPDDWIVGGRSLTEHRKNSFYFDIRVTDETNTKDEKAAFIAAAFDAFAKLLGDLHEESYIHVQDVRAASYGYGGHTQEYRYHHA